MLSLQLRSGGSSGQGPVLLRPGLWPCWLPADHLAWFILDVVDQLEPFLRAYRADGNDHPPPTHQLMLRQS